MMTNPTKLLITVANGQAVEQYVEMTNEEYAQVQADAAAFQASVAAETTATSNAATYKDWLETKQALALALADKLDANTATAAEQRQALALCLRGLVKVTKVVYRTYDQPA